MPKAQEGSGAAARPRCFVISPIGEPGSATRERADKLLKHILSPVVQDAYEVVRSDKEAKSGVVTDQIVQHILSDELVVADLSGSNPNVFYELAIRHATRKAFVQVIEEGEKIPFDNFNMRTIQYGFDVEKVERCRAELREQIRDAVANSEKLTSPISISQDLALLATSGNPLEKTNAAILKMLQEVRSMVGNIGASMESRPMGMRMPPPYLDELLILFEDLAMRTEHARGKRGEPLDDRTAMLLHRLGRLLSNLCAECGYPPEIAHRFRVRMQDLEQSYLSAERE